VVSVAPGLRLVSDDRVWIDFDQAKLHLFDGSTEQALASEP
jgi:multiple sugar transport system ATP-binding protein